MSQIIKNLASGPVPPPVPTSFVTDVNSPAIPIANVLDVFGGTTSENNNNGVQTDGSSGSDILTIQLTNRSRATAITSDGAGQTQTINLFIPVASTGITFVASFVGYDSANNIMAGGELVGIARTSSLSAVSVVGTNDTFDESDAALMTADWDIITDGVNLQAQFVGVAGHSISWTMTLIYDQTP